MAYVCGAQIEYESGEKIAGSPMYVSDDLAECVSHNLGLHSSFGYAVYEVDTARTVRTKSTTGMTRGFVTGYPVIGFVGYAFGL